LVFRKMIGLQRHPDLTLVVTRTDDDESVIGVGCVVRGDKEEEMVNWRKRRLY
jgi:hypothetical protein